jgi:hypothetical protein
MLHRFYKIRFSFHCVNFPITGREENHMRQEIHHIPWDRTGWDGIFPSHSEPRCIYIECALSECSLTTCNMSSSTFVIILICIVSATLSARTFRITNKCDQKIWLGMQGQPLIYNGGFEINARSMKTISVPDGWVCLFFSISKIYCFKNK